MSAAAHRIYLDTNVILDVIEQRRKESVLLLEKIRDSNWHCCTSVFALCELIDIEQQFIHIANMLDKKYTPDHILRRRRQKLISPGERQDAMNKVRGFFEGFPVEVLTMETSGWTKTLEILRDCNICACDSIQVATAIEDGCTVFVSSDEELGKQAKKLLPWSKPEEALRTLH